MIKVGDKYHFFDDGKIHIGRHHIATVTDVVKKEDFKEKNNYIYKSWEEQKEECEWVYADDTDYFVICDIPDYDEDPIYFVRTRDGGWFSIDNESGWQAGRLDVEKFRFEHLTTSFGITYTDEFDISTYKYDSYAIDAINGPKTYKTYSFWINDSEFLKLWNINDIVKYICEHWGVVKSQIKFDNYTYTNADTWNVDLYGKMGSKFATIGFIYENN